MSNENIVHILKFLEGKDAVKSIPGWQKLLLKSIAPYIELCCISEDAMQAKQMMECCVVLLIERLRCGDVQSCWKPLAFDPHWGQV